MIVEGPISSGAQGPFRARIDGGRVMTRLSRGMLALPLALMGLVACQASKSSTPTSPSVAGPIAGVSITTPAVVSPAVGATVYSTDQPVTLTVANSATNGVRAITYNFEVAADSGFSAKVVSREGVEPGSGGSTSFRIPDALASDRTYFWRAKAVDGANQSDYSAPGSFAIVTPVIIRSPVPLSPTSGATTSSRSPEFKVTNAVRSGPAGAIYYTFEISSNLTFTAMVAIVTLAEQSVETRFTIAQELAASTKYYWRVRAFDSNVASDWSLTQSFVTPAAAPTTPPPTPNPGGTCDSSNPDTIVKCERAKYGHMSTSELYSFLVATAKSLNRNSIPGLPFGILRKSGGSSCNGYACDIICAGQDKAQRQYDVLGDADGAQTAGWGSPKTYPDIRIDVCDIQ
jgi:hypothetical protein